MKNIIRLTESELRRIVEETFMDILTDEYDDEFEKDDSEDISYSVATGTLDECGWSCYKTDRKMHNGRDCLILYIQNDAGTHSIKDLHSEFCRRCRRIEFEFGTDDNWDNIIYLY